MKIEIVFCASIETVSSLHRLSWEEVFDPSHLYPSNGKEKWTQVLRDQNFITLLALGDGVPVGYLHISSESAVPEICDLFVISAARRRGIARALLKRAIAENPSIKLWVARSNRGAISLYEEEGFKFTGRTKSEPRRKDSSELAEMTLV